MPEKVNPVVKLFALVLVAIMVFLIDSVFILLCFVILLIALKVIYNIKGRFGKGILLLVVAIFLAQIVFVPKGEVIAELWLLKLTWGSIKTGFLIAGRFFLLITMSWIFVGTTEPKDLASGLANIGIPYRYSFLLILAMRFAPIFQFELSNVQQAQKIRGLKIDKGLKGLIKSIRYTTLPLLFSALSKVNTLASSMEGRGFGAYKKKTFLHPVKFTLWDAVLIALFILFSFEVYWINHYYVSFPPILS
ncbi:MAG: energy-coupling factor transporter transmembrane component T family protein [Candidatus Saliniplasma sp.]